MQTTKAWQKNKKKGSPGSREACHLTATQGAICAPCFHNTTPLKGESPAAIGVLRVCSHFSAEKSSYSVRPSGILCSATLGLPSHLIPSSYINSVSGQVRVAPSRSIRLPSHLERENKDFFSLWKLRGNWQVVKNSFMKKSSTGQIIPDPWPVSLWCHYPPMSPSINDPWTSYCLLVVWW